MRVCLKMPENAGAKLRARLDYAFRLFCAIYGHQPAAGSAAEVTLRYRDADAASSPARERVVWMSRSYQARHPRRPAPPPIGYSCGSVNTWLHAAPAGEDCPDWLGEIFEWVSCADEYSVTDRDSVGRPLFASSYAVRHGLDTKVPYAGLAMHLLQQDICRAVPRAAAEPRHPCGRSGHFVIPTHDVDYFPLGRMHAAGRLARNAAISCLNRQPWLGVRQTAMSLRMFLGCGKDPLDRIAALVEEERRRGFRASYNFLTRHCHRRDACYTLQRPEVVECMRRLERCGMEVGIHSSYTCLDQPGGLQQEAASLAAHGFSARGGRQHWLRFTLDRLIPVIERSGLAYDSSIGWTGALGFRAGACFPFPPYNFEEERAASFLEIPLVMMEQALGTQRRSTAEMFEEAASLLAQSRRLGWGGISLLWHPAAFGEGWLPSGVGDIYWQLADRRMKWGDEWLPARAFIAAARQRFVDAGLLPGERTASAGAALSAESDLNRELTTSMSDARVGK